MNFSSNILILMSLMIMMIQWNTILNWSILLELKMINLNWMNLSMMMIMDFYSMIFFNAILFITGMIFYYSIFYMQENFKNKRFYWSLFMFFISMVMLIFSINMFSMMIGWDGLGLTSMILIFYYGSFMNLLSSYMTFLMTRLGDIFILIAISFSMKNFYIDLNNFFMNNKMVILLFMLGMFTKSAQYPFSAWLPLAMAAPTPVSSLVHSSTLVTAGVYLMIRFNLFFNKKLFIICYYLSLFTMLMAGIIACNEQDMKKTIAMSTLSQMGFMTFMISLGEEKYAFFHLIIHAFFKSLLFLLVGMTMKNYYGEQDSRQISLNMSFYLFFFSTMFIMCISLYGFPFFSGFLVKDIFIESLFQFETLFSFLFFWLACIFTSIYSMRIFMEIFFLYKRGNKIVLFNLNVKFIIISFLMNLFIIYMSSLMLNYFTIEELFLMMNFDKMFIMMIYFLSFFWLSFMPDLVLFFMNYYLTMIFLIFWSYTFPLKFSFMKDYKNYLYENSWNELMTGSLIMNSSNKSKYFSFMLMQSMKMMFFILIFMLFLFTL